MAEQKWRLPFLFHRLPTYFLTVRRCKSCSLARLRTDVLKSAKKSTLELSACRTPGNRLQRHRKGQGKNSRKASGTFPSLTSRPWPPFPRSISNPWRMPTPWKSSTSRAPLNTSTPATTCLSRRRKSTKPPGPTLQAAGSKQRGRPHPFFTNPATRPSRKIQRDKTRTDRLH